ncbi:MAG: hypothetical protein ACP5RT_03005 [Candidatus Micrarchaeia archaeon]
MEKHFSLCHNAVEGDLASINGALGIKEKILRSGPRSRINGEAAAPIVAVSHDIASIAEFGRMSERSSA